MTAPTLVLKLGGSVLASEESLVAAVHEIYRFVRDGRRVVVVASALGGTTEALLATARRWSASADGEAQAALLATGEAHAAALLTLAVERAGLPARVLDVDRIGLRAHGPVAGATPTTVDVPAIRRALDAVPVVVLPGFVARDEQGRTVLLGRGGSDLTAVFLGACLDAPVRLVKDVAGLFERDPALPGIPPRRYRTIRWDDALALDGRIVQHAAVRHAASHRVAFDVAGLNRVDATRIGADGPTFHDDEAPSRPLRITLLGLGTVGLGTWHALAADPLRFEVVQALVRRPRPYLDLGVASDVITTDPAEALDARPDVVVDALTGSEPSATLVATALARGIDVVTANKESLVLGGPRFLRLAAQSGARLLASATVGGGVPILETLRALDGRRVVRIDAVANGTTTFVLDRLAQGDTLAAAVRRAQHAGFAEPDPREDLDGTDAARKLVLLARAAFGSDIALDDVERSGLETIDAGEVARDAELGRTWRLVATAVVTSGEPPGPPRRSGRNMGRGKPNGFPLEARGGPRLSPGLRPPPAGAAVRRLAVGHAGSLPWATSAPWPTPSSSDGVVACVAPRRLERDDVLAAGGGEAASFVVTCADGGDRIVVRGKGAGRHPTTESIVGDLMELERARHHQDGRCLAPLSSTAELAGVAP